jgi:hypothetical protein
MLSAFVLLLLIMGYVWWPLAQEYLAQIDWQGAWWRQFDWLLIGIFGAMSLLIMARADIKADALIIFVGFTGGLVIESWGTQTELWSYYTLERPPLWIIPAWPIASLSIDRLVKVLDRLTSRTIQRGDKRVRLLYWLVFSAFTALMLAFVWPTLDKSFTLLALLLCATLILTPTDERLALLTFAAGSGLGYFLERWGTTRLCWSYYTLQTPPLFAVFAHGMAAVAFWRVALLVEKMVTTLRRATGR